MFRKNQRSIFISKSISVFHKKIGSRFLFSKRIAIEKQPDNRGLRRCDPLQIHLTFHKRIAIEKIKSIIDFKFLIGSRF
jgi:hypothetical protein